MASVDVRVQWQEWKGKFKKVFAYLKPSDHYTFCQQGEFYTDVQTFMQESWQYRHILRTISTEKDYKRI
jgi:hypothetical protein